jgi:hypothetical protein
MGKTGSERFSSSCKVTQLANAKIRIWISALCLQTFRSTAISNCFSLAIIYDSAVPTMLVTETWFRGLPAFLISMAFVTGWGYS